MPFGIAYNIEGFFRTLSIGIRVLIIQFQYR